MADKGKADRAVVQLLINDLDTFNNFVHQEISSMMAKTEELVNAWNDPQYKQFRDFMSELTESLKKDLNVLEEAKIDLENREIHHKIK